MKQVTHSAKLLNVNDIQLGVMEHALEFHEMPLEMSHQGQHLPSMGLKFDMNAVQRCSHFMQIQFKSQVFGA